jgi:DNA topoisomerase-2
MVVPTYEKLDQREHVLKRPGMYIGSVKQDEFDSYVFEESRIFSKRVKIAPAFVTIFDEVLNNAIDHSWRCISNKNPVKNIKVTISDSKIQVWNDGSGIPVEKHSETGIMIPELIFGNMLTSSNYDDNVERTVGGQNGVGAKSTNIFSREFHIDTCDGVKKYCQTWHENMELVDVPSVSSLKRAPYTSISFLPDYPKFGMNGLDNDARAVLLKRAADACAVTPSTVSVWIDGVKLPHKSFERYVDLYIGQKNECARYYEKFNDDWEVCTCVSDDGNFKHISFVNGICTSKGGKHVEHVALSICKKVAESMTNKRGGASQSSSSKNTPISYSGTVKPQHVRNSLWLFLRCTIPNPTFDSQTKDCLTTPVSGFRTRFECSQSFADKMAKGTIGEKAISFSRTSDENAIKKTDGKMKSTVSGIPKLEDAHLAGTSKSHLCTLILTEGDSAKTMAVSGLSVVGRDKFGVFPLKGKLLNTRETSASKIAQNDEIIAIKKIVGLESGKDYSTPESKRTIRYGSILVLADQDVDGYHIRGLVFNLFHSLWPSLFNTPGFLTSMLTPVVKVFTRSSNVPISFYNVPDFETFIDSKSRSSEITRVKYYKGLGTSTSNDAKEYFKDMKKITYTHENVTEQRVRVNFEVVEIENQETRVVVKIEIIEQGPDDAMDMAFNKSRANDRKDWIRRFENQGLDYTQTKVPFVEFINRELRLFSMDDLGRSIPSVIDGLKTSQRKILYACKLRPKSAGELRVAQLAGFVSEKAAYHHGEASLQSTIVGLAQNFVGSNNIPLLQANGQFGSRLSNGKDAASARYIYTDLQEITKVIFPESDEPVLKRALDDDRNEVEPLHYAPLLPMVLVNGANGIGTGFSTNVPKYNPKQLAEIYIDILKNGKGTGPDFDVDPKPWYNGFKGEIKKGNDGKWYSIGIAKRLTPTSVEITELPVATWTDDYKTWIEEKSEELKIKKFDAYHTESIVRFVIHFESKEIIDALVNEDGGVIQGVNKMMHALKLVSEKALSTSNMYLFDKEGRITLYQNTSSIIRDHFKERIRVYRDRKRHEIRELESKVAILSTKAKFIGDVISGDLVLNNAPENTLEEHGKINKWTMVDDTFDYLAKMPMSSVTKKRFEAITKERDEMREKLYSLRMVHIEKLYCEELKKVVAFLE